MAKMKTEQIHELSIIKQLFGIWKQENLDDNLSFENATDPNSMDWYGVINDGKIVGFYAMEKRLRLLAIIYVSKESRHKGLAKQIIELSNCTGIQLGFYNQESLQKTKDAFKDIGYTEHRILVYKTPFAGIAAGEVLAKPTTTKHVSIPGFHYITADDKSLVRV